MKSQASTIHQLRRVTTLMDSPLKTYVQIGFFLIAESLDPVLTAFALKHLIDSLVSLDASRVWQATLLYLTVMVLCAVVSGAGVSVRVNLVEELARKQREGLMKAGVGIPLLEFERLPRGDLVSRLTSDIGVSSRVITECYLLARIALRAVAAAVYMITLNWQVAIACALTGPLTLVVSGFISKPINKRSEAVQKAIGQVSSEALNTLEGVQVIKSYLAEASAERRFLEKASVVKQAAVKMVSVFALNAAWMGTGSLLPFIVTFGYGGYMAVQGKLTLGGILALVNLCNNLGWPLAALGQHLASVQRSFGAFRRITEILDMPQDVDPVQVEAPEAPEVTKATKAFEVAGAADARRPAEAAEDAAGTGFAPATEAANAPVETELAEETKQAGLSIIVRDLSFEYVKGSPVLRDISLDIPSGSLVVLAGKSGCGKSTLIKILAGLYRPAPGTVFIGCRDLHYQAGWARTVTAYLPQEPFLFSGSLRENLSLARPEASDDELREALAIADALDFVHRDEDGLDRTVAERGTSFSGGERQRLCIARTLLKGASVLLVDEPTSSVDKESEERIWSSLLKAMKGKTCIVATHRLDIAQRADLVVVMEAGRIVECGTHGDLYKPGSVYASLVGGTEGVIAG